ncbi:hypothetical protein KAI78_02435 [bacterium]|nr:hypothetical protein [bacterium]
MRSKLTLVIIIVLLSVSAFSLEKPLNREQYFNPLGLEKLQDDKAPFYFCFYVIPYDYLWVSLRSSMYNDCYGNYAITAGTNAWWFGWLANPAWAGGWAPYFAGWQYPKNLGEHLKGQIASDQNVMWGYNGIISDFLWEGDIQSPEDSLTPYPGSYKDMISFYGYYFSSINEELGSLSQSDYVTFAEDSYSRTPLGIFATVRNLRWNYPNADAFNIHIMTLENTSEYDYPEFYIGVFMDPDVDWDHAAKNVSYYDPSLGTAYSYYGADETLGVAGLTIFDTSTLRSVKLDLTYENWGDWGNDEAFWTYLTSDQIQEKNAKPQDALLYVSMGPFDLPMGATAAVSWANPMGYDVVKFKKNAATARKIYNNDWLIPNPPPEAPFLEVETGDRSVFLKWSRNRNYIPKPLPGGLEGYYSEADDPSPEYSIGSESSEDPPDSGIRDWDGYRVYRNLTGMGDIELGDYALVVQLESTYVKNHYGEIPVSELHRSSWNETYFMEYTDTDPSIFNGFTYYYSVVAYDTGDRTTTPPVAPAYSSALANVFPVTPEWHEESTPADYKYKVEVVPNPYIEGQYSYWETSYKRVDFIHLPSRCSIKIYTMSGMLARTIEHYSGDADEAWNLDNDSGQLLAPGVYIFRVVPHDGSEEITGKFMIIR